MMRLLLLGASLGIISAAAKMESPIPIQIDENVKCGEQYMVKLTSEYQLLGNGASSETDCVFTFNAGAVQGSSCQPGLCYMFNTYAKINTSLVSLSVKAGPTMMTYTNQTRMIQGPVCLVSQDTINITITQQEGYIYSPEKPDYAFRLAVYHHCSEKGQVKNIKFEDALDHADGYHYADEKESRERITFIYGIVCGFALAASFLVVFIVSYCVTRNSPKRGTTRTVSVSKGISKAERSTKGPDVEMRSYKPIASGKR